MKSSLLKAFGFQRVRKPVNTLPLAADELDAAPVLLNDEEILLDLDFLQLDATSMKEIRDSCRGDLETMKTRILKIVAARGKMHHPVTHSGGVLVGRIRKIGPKYFERHGQPPGAEVGALVIPVASLTSLPMQLEAIESITDDQVKVRGTAIAFSCMRVCVVPDDLGPELTLTCVDISSLVPQLKRNFETCRPRKILVLGCGKAGMTALYALRSLRTTTSTPFEVLAVDHHPNRVMEISRLGIADHAACLDARDPSALLDFVSRATQGQLCDLILNLVNIPGTETATVLSARESNPPSTILWFSMATRFDQVALATDGLGKDVAMLIGNGVAHGQVDETFDLVRAQPELKRFLQHV